MLTIDTSGRVPYKGVNEILDRLHESEQARERYLEQFPDQEEDIAELKAKRQCRCRATITKFLLQLGEKECGPLAISLFDEPCEVVLPRSIAGEWADMPHDPNIYHALIQHCLKYGLAYRGVSLIPGTNDQRQPMLRAYFW